MTKHAGLETLSLNVYENNDTQALSQLYERLAPELRNYLYWLGASREETDDILADAFLQGWSALRRKHIQYVRSYFQRAARNGFYNRRRNARNRQRLTDRVEEAYVANLGFDLSPLDLATVKENTAEMQSNLHKLPESFRQILTLFYLEELSQQEIAYSLGIPLGTAASRLHRALKAFRAILTERQQDD